MATVKSKKTANRKKTVSKSNQQTRGRNVGTTRKTPPKSTNKRQQNNTYKSDSKVAKKEPKTQSQLDRRNQTLAISLLFIAALLFFIVIIPGESLWRTLHNGILGLFGVMSIAWPLLLAYVSITTAVFTPKRKVSTKVWLTASFILLVCTSIYLFRTNFTPSISTYGQTLLSLFHDGSINKGGGLFSGILGMPLACLLGIVGSRVVIILAICANAMFLTGVTILDIFKTAKKPAKKIKENITTKSANKKAVNVGNDEFDEVLQSLGKPMGYTSSDTSSRNLDIDINMGALDKNIKAKRGRRSSKISPELDVLDSASQKLKDDSAAVAAAAYAEKMLAEQNMKKEITENIIKPQIRKDYVFPSTDILDPPERVSKIDVTNELRTKGEVLVDTLKSFGVQTKIVDISRGPAVTRYELQPGAGVKISKITNLADDLALNLAAAGVRIEAPIPGKAAVGIEVPNEYTNVVKMREVLESNTFKRAKSNITVGLGKDIAGNVTVADLGKMPHLLIAGSTGSGKSVCINSLIVSMLYKASPDEVKFLMVDPKVVELGHYNSIPHLLVPVVTDPRKAAGALNWAVTEMLKRYKLFAEYNVKDLSSYNNMVKRYKGRPPQIAQNNTEDSDVDIVLEPLPQIVIIIDELADLMMVAPNEVEDAICRLAQMARAAGMHLVIATQRPSVDVITGIIKANIPSRIAFAVSSAIDSRTILDSGGAEKLLGRGDMLFAPVGTNKPLRIQGCFLTDREISVAVDAVKDKKEIEYDEEVIEEIEKNIIPEKKGKGHKDEDSLEDPMFDQAIECVVEAGQASTSYLQRKLRLGYARAGRLMDQMEEVGIVGPKDGSKPRKVLITRQQMLERNLQQADNSEE